MEQVLHKRAKTTYLIRQEIKTSKLSLKALAKKFGISISTVYKWRKREDVRDKPMGNGRSNSILTKEEEEIICEARRKTWLPLDDLFDHLKPAIANLSRSNLHRCLKYHGISRVPQETLIENLKLKESKSFKSYEIGFLHIDITEFYLQQRKWFLYVAIDRTCKLCYAKLFDTKTMETSVSFLEQVIKFFPYKIHRILTDNGTQFTYRDMPNDKRAKLKRHPFSKLCLHYGIKHKLTNFYSPQTNGQVERMNYTIKEATLRFFHYNTIHQFESSLNAFLDYYNCQKKLKALKRVTPYEYILSRWKEKPSLFLKNPYHHCVGLNI